MVTSDHLKRYVAVATGCCLLTTAGITVTFVSLENEVKERLSLSQTQSKFLLYVYMSPNRKLQFKTSPKSVRRRGLLSSVFVCLFDLTVNLEFPFLLLFW